MTMTTLESTVQMKGDLDICVCGDHRRSHVDGTGACKFNRWANVGHGGADNCDSFRPATLSSSPFAGEK